MTDEKPIYEQDIDGEIPDPDETPIRDRKLVTQPYDLAVDSLVSQIENSTIFLRPLSERPRFQRRYVWSNNLASKLIESILLKVPIPPCYLSQNDEYELDVIDGQQRLFGNLGRSRLSAFIFKVLTAAKLLFGSFITFRRILSGISAYGTELRV